MGAVKPVESPDHHHFEGAAAGIAVRALSPGRSDFEPRMRSE
jgi:hypothetical protein